MFSIVNSPVRSSMRKEADSPRASDPDTALPATSKSAWLWEDLVMPAEWGTLEKASAVGIVNQSEASNNLCSDLCGARASLNRGLAGGEYVLVAPGRISLGMIEPSRPILEEAVVLPRFYSGGVPMSKRQLLR